MRLMHSFNYYSQARLLPYSDTTIPLTSYNSFQQIAIGDRVEYKDRGCWHIFGTSKTYQGVVEGMEHTDVYLVRLDNGETVPLKRTRLRVISPTYQNI